MENKICVYAICKNEEQFVEKWFKSMSEADWIVVLDTGSTDSTVEKLKEFKGNIIVEQKEINPWRFDVARNEALKLVPEECNILVSTDLDEIFVPGWAKVLRDNWNPEIHERAEYKYTWSHLPNGEEGRTFHYNKIHSKNWIWKYPVHELLINIETGKEDYPTNKVLYLFNELHLHHYPDQNKSRGSYLPLLELRAQEDEEDYYGLLYLIHEYYYRGFYDKSIDLINKVLEKYKDKYNSLEQASCYLFKGDNYSEKDEKDKAEISYSIAITLEPTYREPYIGYAKMLIAEEKYDIAEIILKTALEKTYRHYTWLERDTSWTYEIYDLLCVASFYNGHKKDSLAYAVKAHSYDTTDERLKHNLNIILESLTEKDYI